MSFNSVKTLFWAPEFHDTAKLPGNFRIISLAHAQKLYRRASNMLYRAVKYASQDVIGAYSLSIKLPPQTIEELQALKEPSHWDSDSDSDSDSTQCSELDESFIEMGSASDFSNDDLFSSSAGEDPDSSQELDDTDSDEESDTEMKEPNNLLRPHYWPVQFKDKFDVAEIEYCDYLQHTRERARILGDLTSGNPVNNKDIVHLLSKESKVSPPAVTAQGLIKLKRCIDELQHFCSTVSNNIEKIYRDSYRSRAMRLRHPHGSPKRLRSQRLGSSLRYSTAVGEEWSEEGEWGMPPTKKKRPMI
ncbi:hypothetical protein NW762_006607 [Fusarium torreyae]|uniref:Uncharacterized protein n=1 Tax=Fusarium torreyae TaxID=1237075 RepID=A0A9W8RZB4_9HYPO|nr:hypothetical protein NW762_006607 [Fusarium torreyae]